MPEKYVYVIHRHRASRLHYDLRLEMDGVLKSWALPKDPPRQKGIKRLAVQVEDHPIGYEKFEGRIPEGRYGAGEVTIWDKGYYTLLERKPDTVVIDIRGRKLKGEFCLVKLKSKPGKDKKTEWLFFKR